LEKITIGKLPIYRAAPPNVRDNLIVIDKEIGAKNLSVGIGIYSKGQTSEFHVHSEEEEVMIYTKGKGIMKTIDGKEVELKEGDVTYVPAGEKHQLINTGDEDFVFLFIYTPAGPEKNIRKWNIVEDGNYSIKELF
jgi:quercetin dioxygenase-like cupin family protein